MVRGQSKTACGRRPTMARLALMLAATVTIVAVSAVLPVAAAFDTRGLQYGFSECVDNTRTLFFYADDPMTCQLATAETAAFLRTLCHDALALEKHTLTLYAEQHP